MPAKNTEETDYSDAAQFDWNVTHAKLKKAFPLLAKILAEFSSLNVKSLPITVMRDNGAEEYPFTMAEYKLLEDYIMSNFSLLKTNRVKPRVGATQTLTPIFLGPELLAFFTDEKLISDGAFDIVEYNDNDEEETRRNPYKQKGNPLKPLREQGLIFAATAANLFRAYGSNRNLISLATHNKNIHDKFSGKKGMKEEEIEKKYNRAYVGFDDAAKKHLKALIARMGDYYKNKPKKPVNKGASKKGPTKQSVTPTDVAKTKGFDPDQFQFNAMIQSLLKIGKLSPPEDSDIAFAAGKLTKEQMDRLTHIKTEKVENDDYKALLAQDEATMTSEKIENRRRKKERAAELAKKKLDAEAEDEDDEEEDAEAEDE